jgi:hypothetical protein
MSPLLSRGVTGRTRELTRIGSTNIPIIASSEVLCRGMKRRWAMVVSDELGEGADEQTLLEEDQAVEAFLSD